MLMAASCSSDDDGSSPSLVTVNDLSGIVEYRSDTGQWTIRVSDNGHTSFYIVKGLESAYQHEKLKVVFSGTAVMNNELSDTEATYFDLNMKGVRPFYKSSLYGKWRISSYGTDQERKDIKPTDRLLIREEYEQFFTLTLNPDRSMTGYTSINEIRGVFVSDANEFLFTTYVTTKDYDGNEEFAYVSDRIPRVRTYNIDSAGNLLLYYSDNEYLLLVKVGEVSMEQKNPFIGRWELIQDIQYWDTVFYESGSGYIEFTEDGICRYPKLEQTLLKDLSFQNIGYTFDCEYIIFNVEGQELRDHYELSDDGTLLRMYNFQYDVFYFMDPKIPISVYKRQ